MNFLLGALNQILNILRDNPKIRLIFLLLSGICIAAISAFFFFATANRIELDADTKSTLLSMLGTAFIAVIVAVLSYAEFTIQTGSIELELAPIRKEREEIRERVAHKPEPDIFDTVQLNLNQLAEYYTINKSQARNSFRASVTAIVIGLITITLGIWMFYYKHDSDIGVIYITGVSGVLLEFIGGAYFYLHNRSLVQLNFFFSRLITIQDTMLSIKLCEQISDESRRVAVLEKLIFVIISRRTELPATPDLTPTRERKKPALRRKLVAAATEQKAA
jgi:uncharacterized membrane protein YidH (DUF202 family)